MNRYYVYVLRECEQGNVIYVGKGTNERIEDHFRSARRGDKGALYDFIRERGFEEGISSEVVCNNVSQKEALVMEQELIASYRDMPNSMLFNKKGAGHTQGAHLNCYGYRKNRMTGLLCEILEKGCVVPELMPRLMQSLKESEISVANVSRRIVEHIKEMGNAGYHHKGKVRPVGEGFPFTLDGIPLNVNDFHLGLSGVIKVHPR